MIAYSSAHINGICLVNKSFKRSSFQYILETLDTTLEKYTPPYEFVKVDRKLLNYGVDYLNEMIKEIDVEEEHSVNWDKLLNFIWKMFSGTKDEAESWKTDKKRYFEIDNKFEQHPYLYYMNSLI